MAFPGGPEVSQKAPRLRKSVRYSRTFEYRRFWDATAGFEVRRGARARRIYREGKILPGPRHRDHLLFCSRCCSAVDNLFFCRSGLGLVFTRRDWRAFPHIFICLGQGGFKCLAQGGAPVILLIRPALSLHRCPTDNNRSKHSRCVGICGSADDTEQHFGV